MKLYTVMSGSREYQPYHKRFILDCINQIDPMYTEIRMILGGAKGLDTIMEELAQHVPRIKVECVMPADWSKGKGAGFQRNSQMLAKLAEFKLEGYNTLVMSFFIDELPCNGTADTFKKARKLGFERIYFSRGIVQGITKEFISSCHSDELVRLMLIAGKEKTAHAIN